MLIAIFIEILILGGFTVAVIDDLTAAITQLSTDVTAYIASQAGAVPAAQVEAAVANLNALDATVKAALSPQ